MKINIRKSLKLATSWSIETPGKCLEYSSNYGGAPTRNTSKTDPTQMSPKYNFLLIIICSIVYIVSSPIKTSVLYY